MQAGGRACPFRFRCVGCDHFRTDVSYLPDLTAYLHDLLRDRERALAATDLDDWAKTEAAPSEDEIRKVKDLIRGSSPTSTTSPSTSGRTSPPPPPRSGAPASSPAWACRASGSPTTDLRLERP